MIKKRQKLLAISTCRGRTSANYSTTSQLRVRLHSTPFSCKSAGKCLSLSNYNYIVRIPSWVQKPFSCIHTYIHTKHITIMSPYQALLPTLYRCLGSPKPSITLHHFGCPSVSTSASLQPKGFSAQASHAPEGGSELKQDTTFLINCHLQIQ